MYINCSVAGWARFKTCQSWAPNSLENENEIIKKVFLSIGLCNFSRKKR